MIVIVIVSLIALLLAHYMWQRDKIRKEEQHERRMEKFKTLMEQLKKANENSENENKQNKNEQS